MRKTERLVMGHVGWSLRQRLATVGLVAALPAVLLLGGTYAWVRHATVQAGRALAERVAGEVARRTRLQVGSALEEGLALARVETLTATGMPKTIGVLESFVHLSPRFRYAALLAPDGRLLAEAGGGPLAPPSKDDGHAWFTRTRASVRPLIEQTGAAGTGAPLLRIGIPVRRTRGEMVAALLLVASPVSLERAMSPGELPAGYTVTVRDAVGRTILVKSGERRGVRTGRTLIRGEAEVTVLGWDVSVTAPRREVVGVIDATAGLLLLVLTLLVAGALVWIDGLAAQPLVAGMCDLVQVLQRAAHGDPATRARARAIVELGAVTQAVNTMLDAHQRNLSETQRLNAVLERRVRERTAEVNWLSLAVEQAPVAVLMLDATGVVEHANPHFQAITGYATAKAVGRRVRDLLQESSDTGESLWEHVLSARAWSGEVVFRHQSGERRWLRLSLSPVHDVDGQVGRLVVVVEDATEQRRLIEDLRVFRRAAESTGDGLVVADRESRRVVYVNPAFRSMCGESELWYLRAPRLFDFYDSHFRSLFDREIEPVLRTTGVWTGEITLHGRDGRQFPARHHIFLIRPDAGPRQALGETVSEQLAMFVTDITEQKNLMRLIVQAKAESDAASRAKSVFLANTAHALYTPLNAVLGFAQLLADDATVPPRGREMAATIQQGGQRLMQLLSDSFALASIESGRVNYYPAVFDLPALIDDAAAAARARGRADGRCDTVTPDPAPDLPRWIRTDPDKLRQIVSALLAYGAGVTDRTAPVHLRLWSEEGRTRPHLRAELVDTYAALDDTTRSHLFDPFSDPALSSGSGALSGLGLPIARRYARLMGGEMEAVNVPSGGLALSLTLPYELAEAPVARRTYESRTPVRVMPGSPTITVLSVDDVDVNRALIVAVLEPLGLRVCSAENGAEALDLFSREKPALVLMDMAMPVMDGFAAIRRIRALPEGHDTPIVALTASVLPEETHRILACGANAVLRKPFDLAELFAMIAQHVAVAFDYADADGSGPGAVADDVRPEPPPAG